MPEFIAYQFDRVYAEPIERYRKVSTIAERDAIPTGKRWEGMLCYVTSESQDYQLSGGTTNLDWINAGAGNYFDVTTNTSDDIIQGVTNLFIDAADRTKLDYITVTTAIDLDTLKASVDALGSGVTFIDEWDASAGTFPGGGTASIGDLYIVSVAGTVDGVSFAIGDGIISKINNASTTTFIGNWIKTESNSDVTSVVGLTGVITKSELLSAINAEDGATADMTGSEISAAITSFLTTADWQTKLSKEEVLDFVSESFSDGSQQGITVQYDDNNDRFNFVVNNYFGVTYGNLNSLINDQSSQNDYSLYEVTDASGFSTIASGRAWVRWKGTVAGNETDYIIVSSETKNTSSNNTRLLTGGMVWVSGLTYKSVNLSYEILGQLFIIPDGTQVTASVGDATNDRKDLIYGDDLGVIGISEGTPSTNPQANTLPFYQLQLSIIDVAANATEPTGTDKTTVYTENAGQPTEANATENTGGVRIDLADEVAPITGLKSIRTLSALNDADTINLSLSTPVSISDFSSLEYDIKLLEAWGNDYIAFGLYNGAAFVGFINVTSSFLDTSNITDVQTVTLFKDSFTYGFTYSSNPMEFDTIKIISRVREVSTMRFVLDNIYINIDPNTTQPTKILGTDVELDTTNFDKNLDNTITDVQKFAQAYNNSDIFPIIYILGRPWELRKTVNQFDLTKRTILESNDVIVGSRGPGEYEFLRYDGGDQTDFDNSYTLIAGI